MPTIVPAADSPRWQLAAETIAVKIRWFGLLLGFVFVNLYHPDDGHQAILNAILALGAVYTLLDTYFSLRGQVFLGQWPLLVSAMRGGGLPSRGSGVTVFVTNASRLRATSGATRASRQPEALSSGITRPP